MITVTDSASQKIKENLATSQTAKGLRIGVKSGGCSGFSYIMELVDDISDKDMIFKMDGYLLVVDIISFLYISDITLDYKKTMFSEGFEFINPGANAKCGCGKSFTF
jgi:iron-sulfur cluster assembly protein